MTETEFIDRVRKVLLNECFPGDNGDPEHLPSDYVEELLLKKNWFGTATKVHDAYNNRNQYNTEDAWIEATANWLWTDDNC